MCSNNCNQGRDCNCKPQMEVCPAGTLAELARLREQLAAYEAEPASIGHRAESMLEAAKKGGV